jgi:hypothetical protein
LRDFTSNILLVLHCKIQREVLVQIQQFLAFFYCPLFRALSPFLFGRQMRVGDGRFLRAHSK